MKKLEDLKELDIDKNNNLTFDGNPIKRQMVYGSFCVDKKYSIPRSQFLPPNANAYATLSIKMDKREIFIVQPYQI